MTFFYDLNKRLADLENAKSKKQITEGIKGEIAGGVGGALAGAAMGGPVGATVGGAIGAPLGRKLGGPDETTEDTMVNEIAPLALAAGARALIPLLSRIGPALSRAGRAAAPVARQGAGVAAKGAGQVARQGAEIAAKNALPIGAGVGVYSALTDLASSVSGGVGEVYNDVRGASAALADKIGDTVDSNTLMALAGMAVKYALPIGIVVALLYGGKKIIDKILSEDAMYENRNMRTMLDQLDSISEGRIGAAKAAKPDYIDLDRDGNKTEPMKQAARQAKKHHSANEGNMEEALRVQTVGNRGYRPPANQGERDELAATVRKNRADQRQSATASKYDKFGSQSAKPTRGGGGVVPTRTDSLPGGVEQQPSHRQMDPNFDNKVTRVGAGKNLAKKEMEEGKIDDLRDRREAERRERGEEEQKASTRFVAGRAYGGARQETDDEDDEDSPRSKTKSATDAPRKRGRPKGTGRSIGAKGPGFTSKLLKKGAIAETDIDPVDQGEYDQEGDMAHDQLSTAKEAAAELRSILDADENLPEWVQKKITMAVDYLDTARDYMKAQKDSVEPVAEKAVSKSQRAAAGIAYAAKKGDLPKSELRGASREMAKMSKGELHKFATTKEKGLPKKKKGAEDVEETTTSGSVATAPAAAPKKGGMQFGRGIYDSLNRELEQMISESMSVNINSSTEGGDSVTVTATDEDAGRLKELLRNAGIGGDSQGSDCGCGTTPCMHSKMVDENQPDWPTNTAQSDDALQYSGGLNKPKTDVAGAGQTTVPVTAVRVSEDDQDGIPFRGKMVDVTSLEVDGVDTRDYPDLVDAYLSRAEYTDGTPLSDDELAEFEQENSDIVHQAAHDSLHETSHSGEDSAYESIQRMQSLAGIQEAKPDFLDIDKDGDKTEPMKKAADDKDDEKVEESILNMRRLWQQYKA